MTNPYLTAALRAQDHLRPQKAAPKTPAPVAVEKAAESAEKSDTTPSNKESR